MVREIERRDGAAARAGRRSEAMTPRTAWPAARPPAVRRCCVAGCATLEAPFRAPPRVRRAAGARMRRVVPAAGRARRRRPACAMRRTRAWRGFPTCASSRLLASLRPAAAGERCGAARARRAHARARPGGAALRNHEPAGRADRGHARRVGRVGLRMALDRTQSCGRLLREIDLAKPESRAGAAASARRCPTITGPANRDPRPVLADAACRSPRACGATRRKRGARSGASRRCRRARACCGYAPPPGRGAVARARGAHAGARAGESRSASRSPTSTNCRRCSPPMRPVSRSR